MNQWKCAECSFVDLLFIFFPFFYPHFSPLAFDLLVELSYWGYRTFICMRVRLTEIFSSACSRCNIRCLEIDSIVVLFDVHEFFTFVYAIHRFRAYFSLRILFFSLIHCCCFFCVAFFLSRRHRFQLILFRLVDVPAYMCIFL